MAANPMIRYVAATAVEPRRMYIVCQRCGRTCPDSLKATIREARKAAKAAGWGRCNDKHRCPVCRTGAADSGGQPGDGMHATKTPETVAP
jgi:hypothetical protein